MISARCLPALVLSFLICTMRALPSLRLCGGVLAQAFSRGRPGGVLSFDAHGGAVENLWE